jgi:chromosome segregation ATPase
MTASFLEIKRHNLEKRLSGLFEEYEAASKQLNRTLAETDRIRLQRQLDNLEQEIQQLESDLTQLPGPDPTEAVPKNVPKINEPDKAALRAAIMTRYSLEQVKTLCEDCGVDYEALGQLAKEPLVRELIRELERRGELGRLAEKVHET